MSTTYDEQIKAYDPGVEDKAYELHVARGVSGELLVMHVAVVVRSPALQQKLRTYAIRTCAYCGRALGEPRSETEYESDFDVCSDECWLHVKRGD